MFKEYQDAARKEERQKLLMSFMPAVAGIVLSLSLAFIAQYTNLFSLMTSWFVSS
jgi:hypothetical protein